jgi:hypothetical protein
MVQPPYRQPSRAERRHPENRWRERNALDGIGVRSVSPVPEIVGKDRT